MYIGATSGTCSDSDDATVQADTGGLAQSCAQLATYCADDSYITAQGAPAGWLASTCPATCGLCGGSGTNFQMSAV